MGVFLYVKQQKQPALLVNIKCRLLYNAFFFTRTNRHAINSFFARFCDCRTIKFGLSKRLYRFDRRNGCRQIHYAGRAIPAAGRQSRLQPSATRRKEAQLSALFDVSDLPTLQQELREQGLLDADSTELSIRRIIDAKGKSRSFINNQAATLVQLKQIGSQLIDIHGQNAHHSLNHEAAQRQLLDAFAGCLDLVEQTKSDYQAWQHAKQSLLNAQTQSENLAIERERLEWQVNELAQLNLQTGEWETLNQAYDSLSNADDLLQAAYDVQDMVSGDNGLRTLNAPLSKGVG